MLKYNENVTSHSEKLADDKNFTNVIKFINLENTKNIKVNYKLIKL